MAFNYWQDRNEQNKFVRHNEFANLVLMNTNFIINGCGLTTSSGLTISVASGKVYIAGTGEIDVTSGNLTADAAHATLNRIDLVVVNTSGTKSLIKGTAATFPTTPSYTETDYVCLGHLYIGAAVTTLSSANVINSGIINSVYTNPQSVGTVKQVSKGNGMNFTDIIESGTITLGTPSSLTTSTSNAVTTNSHTHALSGVATDTHVHGQITNAGAVTTNVTVGSGDRLLISDSSNSSIVKGGTAFGTSTSTYLRNDGTFATPPDTTYSEISEAEILAGTASTSRVITGRRARFMLDNAGGMAKYTNSFTSQTSLSINHNLNDSNPIIQVYDENSEQITPDKIEIVDANNIIITFNESTTGFYIMHGGSVGISDTNSDIIPDTTNTFDIGSSTNKYKDGYFAGNLHVAGSILGSNSINDNYVLNLKNHIRQLIDRVGVYSKDGTDLWGEAYTSAGGRNGSVVTAETITAIFGTDKYKSGGAGISYDSFDTDLKIGLISYYKLDSISGTTAIDSHGSYDGTRTNGGWTTSGKINGALDLSTSAGRVVNSYAHNGAFTFSFWIKTDKTTFQSLMMDGINTNWGKIIAITTSGKVRFDGHTGSEYMFGGDGAFISDTSINDNNWNHIVVVFDSTDNKGYIYINSELDKEATAGGTTTRTNTQHSVGGWASSQPGFIDEVGIWDRALTQAEITQLYNLATSQITHTIPSGTFPSNISSAIGSPLVEDWDDGADIQYKITNATEDSGWLNQNEVSEFTEFTSEPDELVVKLIPKETDPTAGTPSIKGFALRCE